MATDVERLVVSLEASITKYQKTMDAALGLTNQRAGQIEARFAKANKNVANGMKPVALQTGNIAAQFQDIAVQLQSGQSPFTIALQQGTQLSAALGSEGGVKGAVAGIVAGFGSMLNPISLATIATIALGGAAVEWLLRTQHGTEDADKALDQHIAEIKKIVDGYDDAGKAVDDYVKRAKSLPQGEVRLSLGGDLTQQQAELTAAIDKVRNNFLALTQTQVAFSQIALTEGVPAAKAEQAALHEIQEAAAAANPDLDKLALELKTFIVNNPKSVFLSTAQSMLDNVDAARRMQTEVGAVKTALDSLPDSVTVQLNLASDKFTAAMKSLKDLAPELRSPQDVAKAAADDAFQKATGSARSISEVNAAVKQYNATISAIDEDAHRQSIKSTASAYDSERKAVTDLIGQLQVEHDTLGMTEQEKTVVNALYRAGSAATDEQRQKIVELINATSTEQEAMKATAEQMQEFADIGKEGLQTFISDLVQGKTATEALGDALSNVGNALLNAGLNSLFGSLFPSTGGGPLAGLFGGHRASGGPVEAGKAYVVGERQPELFVPGQSGMIMPSLPAMSRGGGGQTINFAPVIDARGAAPGVERQIAAALDQFRRFQLPAAVQRINRDPLARGAR